MGSRKNDERYWHVDTMRDKMGAGRAPHNLALFLFAALRTGGTQDCCGATTDCLYCLLRLFIAFFLQINFTSQTNAVGVYSILEGVHRNDCLLLFYVCFVSISECR